MDVEPPFFAPRSANSTAERALRECEIDPAQGNVHREGGILSDEIECLNAHYLALELDSDRLTVVIRTSTVVREG